MLPPSCCDSRFTLILLLSSSGVKPSKTHSTPFSLHLLHGQLSSPSQRALPFLQYMHAFADRLIADPSPVRLGV